MKNQIILSAFIGLVSFGALSQSHAADDTLYNAQKFKQVCKGKQAGSEVSFSYRGVTWNGTCQNQFFPNAKAFKINNQSALIAACSSDSSIKSINIDGKEEAGRCALGFAPPAPNMTQR